MKEELSNFVTLYSGDCLENIKLLPDNSIDAFVLDPPYHLESIVKRFGGKNAKPTKGGTGDAFARISSGFAGKTWDGGDIAFRKETWEEFFRVLKPGGHLVAFAATRNSHRMVTAIEDAGFEIRDSLYWIYGTGMPHSQDVSKFIDKELGQKRDLDNDIPISEEAKAYNGYGTNLKPSVEPICLARKPLSEKTIAKNILKWGTGALNIDDCRIPISEDDKIQFTGNSPALSKNSNECWKRPWCSDKEYVKNKIKKAIDKSNKLGRWPANIIIDGSDEVVNIFPVYNKKSSSRFFYSAKADKKDRANSNHPTIKPIKLIEWLITLVTPPNGIILDPFAGSGTTGQAAQNLNIKCILMEREEEYINDIKNRIKNISTEETTPNNNINLEEFFN